MTTNVPLPEKPTMGRLEPVSLREVWAHEALDFTPWLLANADVLGEALDMDLEIAAAEHPVGGFALDLIATDLRSNERVIIENQIETTDHLHLGQLLTYAGGTDPANIVWIAATFRDEHRAALDWLNLRTDADTRFFGVEISAVRIGDSLPAPLFQVVAKPNDWGKSVRTRASSQEGASSERNALYAKFWAQYLSKLTSEDLNWSRARKPPAQNWFPTSSGVSGVEFTVSFSHSGLRSEIYFGHSDPTVNTARFETLHEAREAMNSAYGSQLSFEPIEDKKACRIAAYQPGKIVDSVAWPHYVDWFVDSQKRLRKAVTAGGGIPKQ